MIDDEHEAVPPAEPDFGAPIGPADETIEIDGVDVDGVDVDGVDVDGVDVDGVDVDGVDVDGVDVDGVEIDGVEIDDAGAGGVDSIDVDVAEDSGTGHTEPVEGSFEGRTTSTLDPADADESGVTDDPAVRSLDAAIGRLDGLDERPLDEHADIYDGVHATLQDALSDTDPGRGRT